MIKRLIAFATVLVLCAVSCVFVSAASFSVEGISVSFPQEYTLLTRKNLSKNSEALELLGYTSSALKKHMTDSDIYAIAVNGDNSGQFVLKFTESDLSKQTYSLNNFDTDKLAVMNNNLFNGNAEVVSVGKLYFFRTKSRSESASFYTYQYITIQNGKLITLIFYGNSSEPIDAAVSKMNIKILNQGSDNAFSRVFVIIIVALIMIAGIVFLSILGFGIYKDFKNRQDNENDVEQYIKIKRRRF